VCVYVCVCVVCVVCVCVCGVCVVCVSECWNTHRSIEITKSFSTPGHSAHFASPQLLYALYYQSAPSEIT